MKTLIYISIAIILFSCQKDEDLVIPTYPVLESYNGFVDPGSDIVTLEVKEFWTITPGKVDTSVFSRAFNKASYWGDYICKNHPERIGKPDSVSITISREVNSGGAINLKMYNWKKDMLHDSIIYYQYLNIETTGKIANIRGKLLYDYPYFIKTSETK